MTGSIESPLATLAEPEPPPTLKTSVMARLSRIADDRPVPSPAHVSASRRLQRVEWRDPLAFVATIAGIVVVSVSWIPRAAEPAQWLAARSLPLVAADLAQPHPEAAAVVALGLLLFLVGLFAPLRSQD